MLDCNWSGLILTMFHHTRAVGAGSEIKLILYCYITAIRCDSSQSSKGLEGLDSIYDYSRLPSTGLQLTRYFMHTPLGDMTWQLV